MIARCECGAPRNPRAEACNRCAWLDGASEAEARLIAALNALGEADNEALAYETGMPRSTMRVTLAKLRKLGRVVTLYDRDEDNRNRATHRLRWAPPLEATG